MTSQNGASIHREKDLARNSKKKIGCGCKSLEEYGWVRSFAVVAFDVGSGHKLEMVMPPESMDEDDRNRIRMPAMPDCNTSFLGDSFYCFRFRKSHGLPLFSSSFLEQSFEYCYALFRQEKDPSYPRGFFQKTIVLVSRFPYVNLFERIVKVIGPLYFDHGDVVLESVLANIKVWPLPLPDTHLALPFMGETIYFHVPYIDMPAQVAAQFRRKVVHSHEEESFFSQNNQSEANKIKSLSQSSEIILPSERPKEIVITPERSNRLFSGGDFPSPLEALTSRGGGPVEGCYFDSFVSSSNDSPHSLSHHSSQSIYSECEDVYDESQLNFEQITTDKSHPKRIRDMHVELDGRSPFAEMLLAEESLRREKQGLFQSMGLYSVCGKNLVEYLWVMWELVITASPVLVVGPNVGSSSALVLSMVSLISPIYFGGDFRPHFTTFDPDYRDIAMVHDKIGKKLSTGLHNEGSENNGDAEFPSLLLGVINPIFLKSLGKWPNAIVLPGVAGRASSDWRKLHGLFGGGKSYSSRQIHRKVQQTREKHSSYKPSWSGISSIRRRCDGKVLVVPRTASLDSVVNESKEPVDVPLFITRHTPIMTPNAEVLSQLLDPYALGTGHSTGSRGEHGRQWRDGIRAINDVLLRRHFDAITREFLSKFNEFFRPDCGSIQTKQGGTLRQRLSIYADVESLFKRFNQTQFLQNLQPPSCLSNVNWHQLYVRFINSHNFRPWFTMQRNVCIQEVREVCRSICMQTPAEDVVKMCVPMGKDHVVQADMLRLLNQVRSAIKRESSIDESLARHMHTHKRALEHALTNSYNFCNSQSSNNEPFSCTITPA